MSTNINLSLPKKYAAQKIINLITLGIMIASVLWSVLFVYQYAFETINNVGNIVMLSSDLSVNLIDLKSYELSQKNIKVKKDIPNLPNEIRNIFYYVESTASAKTTSGVKK